MQTILTEEETNYMIPFPNTTPANVTDRVLHRKSEAFLQMLTNFSGEQVHITGECLLQWAEFFIMSAARVSRCSVLHVEDTVGEKCVFC